MYFTKVWQFIIAAFLVGAFIVLEAIGVVTLQLTAIESVKVEVTFLSVAMAGIVLLFTFMYVVWVQKYIYFFRLRRLLNENSAISATAIQYNTPSGVQYEIAGAARHFTVMETQWGSDTTIIYSVTDFGVSATAKTTNTVVQMDDGYFGEHESVHTRPIGVDQRKTFKHLIGVVVGYKPV